MKNISIFDTTLRDGEQCLDSSFSVDNKLLIAKQLEKLNVDVIEAGFPIASSDEFNAIKKIAQTIKNPVICALGRLLPKDLDKCWEAIKESEKPRIHTFIATCKVHMEYKLRKSPEEVLNLTKTGLEYASRLCDDIEFTVEDGSRSDISFMAEVIETAIEYGATTINIPDTVGYAQPSEFGTLINTILKTVPKIKNVNLSVHCHDDLGLAVANTLEGIKNGVDQVECTINGIGERAGNASLEEIVTALKIRPDFYKARTNIISEELFTASKLVSKITKMNVQKNKAIVGANAFVHKAGIHQHGFIRKKSTYEILTPESVGWIGNEIVISKHSGQTAIADLLNKSSINVSDEELLKITRRTKEYIDKYNSITPDLVIEFANNVIKS